MDYDSWKLASPYEDEREHTEELSFELTCDTDKADDIIEILESFLSNIDVISKYELDEDSIVLQIVADYTYSTNSPDDTSAWDWFYDECYKELYGISGFHNIERL